MQHTQPHQIPAPPAAAPPRQRRKKSTQKKWLPYLILGGFFTFGLMMATLLLAGVGVWVLMDTKIPQGVTVADVDVSGMTREEAEGAVRAATASGSLQIVDNERAWTVSYAEIGIRADVAQMMSLADEAERDERIPVTYAIDLNQAQTSLVALSERANIEAEVGSETPGRVLEIPVTLNRLRSDLNVEIADGVLELDMMEVAPPELSRETYEGESVTHVVEPLQELALIAKEYGVDIDDILALNDIDDANVIYPGQELLIPAAGIYQPNAADAPPAPTNQGRSIVVSTGDQRIYAYEDGQLVRSHITSTGRAETPTVLGEYEVYVKFEKDDMSGPDYFLPDVPYTMYFYRGYGIHGTYWHNSFGRPMSHGCVNLPTDEARWFFEFASVGTPVRVI